MVFSNNLLLGAGGQGTVGPTPFDPTVIGNSVWLDGSADYLSKTPSAGTTTRWIWCSWVQRTEFGNAANAHTIFSAGNALSNLSWIRFDDQDQFDFAVYQGATTARKTSSAKYRDIGWYHLCVSFDSGSGVTASDRIRLFVNGIEVTDLSASTATPSGETTAFNDNVIQEIGRYSYNGSQYGHAYLTQFTMLENKSFQNGDLSITDLLDSFTFGTNGSQFAPKADADIAALASSAGGNSFCLDFSNSGSLGLDSSTLGNNYTPTSMDSTNQSTNTPSLVYPKISNIGTPSGDTAANYTMGLGSNRMVYSGGNQVAKGLISPTLIQPDDPKIYWEYYVETGSVSGDGGRLGNGITVPQFNAGNGNGYYGAGGESAFFYRGTLYDNGSASVSGFTTAQAGDIQQMAFEPSTGKVWIGVEGTWRNGSGTDSTTLDVNNHDDQLTVQDYIFVMGAARSSDIGVINFGDNPTMSGNITAGGNADENGHGNFKYAVPSGFLAPNSANLTAPTYQGIDYFAPTLYQGNGEGQRVGDFVPFTDVYTVNNSAMFNEADERSFRRTPSSAGNQKTWTFSTWIKRTQANADYSLLNVTNSKEVQILLHNSPTGSIEVFFYNGSATDADIVTAGGFEDMSNWHNIVVAVDTRSNGNGGPASADDRIIIYVDGVRQTLSTSDNPSDDYDTLLNTATEHTIGQKPNGADDFQGYLAETVLIDGSQLTASSFGQVDTSTNRWVPKDVSGLTFGTNGFYLKYENSPTNIAASETGLKSDDLNVGAVSLLTDGTQYGSWNAGSNLVYQNSNSTTKSWWGVDFGSGVTKTIKSATIFGNQTGDGSSAGFTSVSGAVTWTLYGSNSAQATSDNDLSSLTSLGTASVADGITKGAAVTIDAASNTTAFRYFYVQMNTTASLRRLLGEIQLYETAGGGITNDSSGQNNDLVAAGAWVAGDQFTDTPSNNVFTFATDGTGTISEGNTRVDLNDSVYGLRPTIVNFSSTGKFYGEFLVNAVSGNSVGIGFARDIASQDTTNPSTVPNSDSKNFLLQLSDGNKINGDSTGVSYGSGISAGQTVMWAFDAATGKIWFGSEGTFFASGDPAAGTNEAFILPNTGTVTLVAYDGSNARTANLTMRNATAAFEHTAPTGFTPFTQDNLDDTQSKLTAFAWIKNRDATDNHMLANRVRGPQFINNSNSNSTGETTNVNAIQRFLQRGVQVGSDVEVNTANESYVLWQWLMGDSATTGSTTSPAGSIASTTIVADADHMSIGTFTGTGSNGTVGHGLSAAPEAFVVFNPTVAVRFKMFYHKDSNASPASGYIHLESTEVFQTDSTIYNNTVPTATVFSVGTNTSINENTKLNTFIAWRSIAGVCKVGSYIGNLNDDGPYVSTGFKPAWIMIKSTTTARDWVVFDTSRDPINVADHRLDPNNTGAEFNAALDLDILSDGFKFRSDDIDGNASGVTYIYVAMADIGGNGTLPPVYGR